MVRIPSHSTVCLIGSPLEQGCSLIFFFRLVINTHERENGSIGVKIGAIEPDFVKERDRKMGLGDRR